MVRTSLRSSPSPRHRRSVVADPLPSVVIKLGRLVERRLSGELSGCGITAAQLVVLIDIARHPGISRADLARELRITPQAVGGITHELVASGLIAKATHRPGLPTAFKLTVAGSEVLKTTADAVHAVHRALLATLVPASGGATDATLRRLLETPQQATARGMPP